MGRKTLIELKDVRKTYQMGEVKLNALDSINLKIENGEFVAITGASGSGKSTMMNLVGCLDIPSQGTIFLDGTDIASLNESDLAEIRGKKIGFIFQKFNLISTLTALDNVILPMDFQEIDRTEAEKKAKKLLDMVGLGDRMHHKPGELSGGQAQRVAIARALANSPEVILADEPTGNLDSKTGQTVMDFLCELHEKEGKTIVLVTHDLNLVNFAKRVVKLKDGKIESDTQSHKVRRKSK
ncbi:MAG: ABC transporter ATP-binding protein [Candidatus Nanoarchaeia archaeon]|nr:ABC transporter ATP-binding protein [Candidatus Nanoarchaeia archaeon]